MGMIMYTMKSRAVVWKTLKTYFLNLTHNWNISFKVVSQEMSLMNHMNDGNITNFNNGIVHGIRKWNKGECVMFLLMIEIKLLLIWKLVLMINLWGIKPPLMVFINPLHHGQSSQNFADKMAKFCKQSMHLQEEKHGSASCHSVLIYHWWCKHIEIKRFYLKTFLGNKHCISFGMHIIVLLFSGSIVSFEWFHMIYLYICFKVASLGIR